MRLPGGSGSCGVISINVSVAPCTLPLLGSYIYWIPYWDRIVKRNIAYDARKIWIW
jgi:hypothetical protein